MISEEEIRKRIQYLLDYRVDEPLVDLMRITSIIVLRAVLEEKDAKDDEYYSQLFNRVLGSYIRCA